MKKRVELSPPDGYREEMRIDLEKNKKEKIFVNVGALVIAAVMALIGALNVPVRAFFDTASPLPSILRIAVMLVGIVAYMVLHEAVHGIFMRLFGGGVKPSFGFTGLYAYAASHACFKRTQYLVIGLSPVVLLGLLLGVLNAFVPMAWFWVVYLIQIVNVSGAAGDLYVSARLLRCRRDVLIRDDGVAMRVYVPRKK